jgi:hypothetical protein
LDSGSFDGVLTKVHAGAELKFFKFIALRAGMNQGYLTMGAGIDLILFELDAALFTQEVGSFPGDKARSGISLQAAVRF